MQKRLIPSLVILLFLSSCYQPQRDCKVFKDGKFTFTSTIGDQEVSTVFVRQGDLEVDYFQGKVDSSSVRWINDCEYIVKKLHPKNKAEEKSVHMKILTTTDNSYTFEYNIVGSAKKSRGTAIKTN
ncbi:DNA topoisomerase IV [Maribacter polysaccharolyticus]|uniref:DNA topoisomerase IV n=1 Tax=Maribacter polysaccharolyticus TaxID=3020831 RepID=UPI00237FB026|nr:DNA topoisomerase IV [Maribacter polysaccharolyticus]MDE3740364.1 DNA topoisomerase IV [Maribacter polysaccharolyticus]